MPVYARLADQITSQMNAIDADFDQLWQAAFHSPSCQNVVHYLLGLQADLHESVARWCSSYLRDYIGSSVDWSEVNNSSEVMQAHARYVSQQLAAIDLGLLPPDLQWAVTDLRRDPAPRDRNVLRLIHACQPHMLDYAYQLQPIIDAAAARLTDIGCNPRQQPLIIGISWTLDQSYYEGRMGRCTGKALADYAFVQPDLFHKWSMYLGHVVTHEMVHTTQNIPQWPYASWAWLEGITEYVTTLACNRTAPGYDAEMTLVEGYCKDIGATDADVVAWSNDNSDLMTREDRLVHGARYALEGERTCFASYELVDPFYSQIMHEAHRETMTWNAVPGDDVQEILAQLIRRSDGHCGLVTRGAALMIWASHVMEESPARAFKWGLGGYQAKAELDAVVRWKNDPVVNRLYDSVKERGDNFWFQCGREAVTADIDLGALQDSQQLTPAQAA